MRKETRPETLFSPRGPQKGLTRRAPGSTMVELLAASLIISVSLIGLISAWLALFHMGVNNDDRSAAYEIARFVVERVRADGYSSVPTFHQEEVGYFRNLTEEDRANSDARGVPIGLFTETRNKNEARFVAYTRRDVAPGAKAPEGRSDLRLVTISVQIFLLNPDKTRGPQLADLQTCLARGGA